MIFLTLSSNVPLLGRSDLSWAVISAWQGETLEWICHVSSLLTTVDFGEILGDLLVSLGLQETGWGWRMLQHHHMRQLHKANSFLVAYREATVTPLKQHNQHSSTPSKWSPPSVGTIKINFDGVVLQKGREARIGGVAHGSNGSVLAGFSCRIQRRVDGEIAKALAMREAAELATKFGRNRS